MDSLNPGMLIGGRFQLDERIDQGGTADIWLAEDLTVSPDSPKRRVVVKAVRSDCIIGAVKSSDIKEYTRRLIERLERECTVHAALSPHRNIVDFIASGELPSGNPYIAMEHLVGKTLLDRIHRAAAKRGIMRVSVVEGKRLASRIDPTDFDGNMSEGSVMPTEDVRKIFEGVLMGLAHMNTNAVTHRDLKPDNIILLPDPNENDSMVIAGVKILDFGLAKASAEVLDLFRVEKQLTEEDYAVGTPTYMPIEQFQYCSECGPQVDVYAAGIILFEAVTGLKPFANCSNPLQVLNAVNMTEWFDPAKYVRDLPRGLSEIVVRATQKVAVDRYEDAIEMLKAFRHVRWPKLSVRSPMSAKSRLSGSKRPPAPPRPRQKSDPPPLSKKRSDPPPLPSRRKREPDPSEEEISLVEIKAVSDSSSPLPAFSQQESVPELSTPSSGSDRPSPPPESSPQRVVPSRPLPPLSPPPPKRISDRPSPLPVPSPCDSVHPILPPPPPLPSYHPRGSDRPSPLAPREPMSRESSGKGGGFIVLVVGLAALFIGVGGGLYYYFNRHGDVFLLIEAALFDQGPSKNVPGKTIGAKRPPESLPVFNPPPRRSARVSVSAPASVPSSVAMEGAALTFYRTGLVLFKSGHFSMARKKFESAEKIAPNDPEITSMIAKCNQRMKLSRKRKR